jgi:hypothetical protein
MADGTVNDGGYSSNGGIASRSFNLDPDEHIVKIEAIQGDRLNGLRVFTSAGRESEWFGRLFDGQGGRIVEHFSASAENPIVGFERNVHGAWGITCPQIIRVQKLNDPPPNPLPTKSAKSSEVRCPRCIASCMSDRHTKLPILTAPARPGSATTESGGGARPRRRQHRSL